MQFKATEVNNHLVSRKIYEHYSINMIPKLISSRIVCKNWSTLHPVKHSV